MEKIKSLNKKINSCKKCEGLNIPKKTMSAFGYGDLKAELFVVGQSLHAYNPRTPKRQIPFVGPIERMDSGNILYKILHSLNYTFKNKNLFITNVVHCHVPKHRKLYSNEIENCKYYLKQELRIIKPKIILTLGTDARVWFNLPRIMQSYFSQVWRDTEFMEDVIFVISYHPSYVMRYGGAKIKEKYTNHMTKSLLKAKEIVK